MRVLTSKHALLRTLFCDLTSWVVVCVRVMIDPRRNNNYTLTLIIALTTTPTCIEAIKKTKAFYLFINIPMSSLSSAFPKTLRKYIANSCSRSVSNKRHDACLNEIT